MSGSAPALTPQISFVFPCLDEAPTLREAVCAVKRSLAALQLPFEVIVADNGSTDGSIRIAEEEGCRVVHVAVRGYGAALTAGILAARGEYVLFADSDGTYLYEQAAELYLAAADARADLAIASRMGVPLPAGAMPPLHRYVGTPALTQLINVLYGAQITDCNSGFRAVRRSAFLEWSPRAPGMEFASELLIRALLARARIVELPSGLRPRPPGRSPHLRPVRDGLRHLRLIVGARLRA